MRIRIIILIIIASGLFKGNSLKGQISGATLVNYGSTYQYTEPTVTGYPIDWTYYFTAIGGTVVSGQTQTQVSITWNIAANGTVQKWKSSTHANYKVLIQSLDVTVQNTPATGYLYDAAGNRIKRQVIILNTSGLKSAHINTEEALVDSSKVEKLLEERLGNLNIKIYPNPTFGRLQVHLAGIDENIPSSISIINITGDNVYNISPVLESNEIDLSDKTEGVYILIISANNETTKWKVVKQ